MMELGICCHIDYIALRYEMAMLKLEMMAGEQDRGIVIINDGNELQPAEVKVPPLIIELTRYTADEFDCRILIERNEPMWGRYKNRFGKPSTTGRMKTRPRIRSNI